MNGRGNSFRRPDRVLRRLWGWALAALLWASAQGLAGAQALPAMPPTAQPSPRPVPAVSPAAPVHVGSNFTKQAPAAAQRARVEYTGRVLRVSANDASLNQILRDVGRATGMKITGGVAEERVFGTYGPDEPAAVLAALLSGTGSNMLLIENVRRMPAELVLTPRQGGPSPPSPNQSVADADEDDLPPQQVRRVAEPRAAFAEEPALPLAAGSGQAPAPAAPAQPAGGTTPEQSPNGVKTPQQVYEQLMKLHQQQPSPAPQP